MVTKTSVLAFSIATMMCMGCTSINNKQLESLQSPNLIWQPEAQLNWEQVKLPGKRDTQYSLVTLNGYKTLKANAQSSASMLRQKIRIDPIALNSLHFSWQEIGRAHV